MTQPVNPPVQFQPFLLQVVGGEQVPVDRVRRPAQGHTAEVVVQVVQAVQVVEVEFVGVDVARIRS